MTTSTRTARTARTSTRTARTSARVALVALVVSLLSVVAPSLTSTAQAAAQSTAANGYAEVKDPYYYAASTGKDRWGVMGEIIRIDTEHANEHGFWYARAYEEKQPSGRTFLWYFQTWGMTCNFSDAKPVFYRWTNAWRCQTEADAYDEMHPGYQAAHAQCASQDPRKPWLAAVPVREGLRETFVCDEQASVAAGGDISLVPAVPAEIYVCAPWEGVNCNKVSYPWAKNTASVVPSMWRPAPDTCTGLPVNANRYKAPFTFATNIADDCTGNDAAPNCPAGDTGIACSTGHTRNEGQNNPAYGWVKAEGSASVSEYKPISVTATRSASTTRKVAAGAAVKVSKKYKGKKYTVAVTGYVNLKASAAATHTETVNVGSTGTGTGACFARTAAAAKTCATARAKIDAKFQITNVGEGAHEGPYNTRRLLQTAESRAHAKAKKKAVKKAALLKPSASQIAKARKAAKARATSKVDARIAKAKKKPA